MKNFLLKIANRIINKYGIHELQLNSKIRLHGSLFEIVNYNLSQSINEYGKLEIECWDVLKTMNR